MKKRSMYVDFTQPYAASDLVVVVPVKKLNSNPWGFLQPFTYQMWFTTVAFFLAIGAIMWLLEHKRNSEFRGEPLKQFVTILSYVQLLPFLFSILDSFLEPIIVFEFMLIFEIFLILWTTYSQTSNG